MLSYSDSWQRRYGADSSIVGRTIELDGVSQTVVGVLPRDFRLFVLPGRSVSRQRFTDLETAAAQPAATCAAQLHRAHVFARLKSNVTLSQAQQETDALMIRFRALYAEHAAAKIRMRLVPLHDDVVKVCVRTLALLLAAAGLVLVIVCANVANLLLARGNGRERELAIRVAMGEARRGLIVSQLLLESLLLAVIGSVTVSRSPPDLYSVPILLSSASEPANLPRLSDVHLDARVLGFALLLSAATSALFGLAPPPTR